MSTKPSDVARWATTGAISVPSSGKQDLGFTVAEKPPAQYYNYLHNLAGLWHQYLSDGNLTGAHTFGSTVGITGLLTASGGITVPTGQAVALQGTTTLTIGAGATVLGGTLDVSDTVTVGNNKNVVLQGTGKVSIPNIRTILLGPDDFCSSSSVSYGSFFSTGTDSIARAKFQLLSGTTIRAIRMGVRDSGGGNTLKFVLNSSTSAFSGAGSPVATSNNSNGTAVDVQIQATALNIAVAAGTAYGLVMQIGSGGSGVSRAYWAEIDFDDH